MFKNELAKTDKLFIIRLSVFIFVIFLIGLGTFYLKKVNNNKKSSVLSLISKTSNAPESKVTTDMPFYDLTIPYLRSRTYKSSLAKLDRISANQNYISNTTSYLSDGLKVYGLLTIPVGETPSGGWPAIVFVHGYIPPKLYETLGQSYSAYVDYLGSNGFVVFKIDLRGNGNSDGTPGGAYYSADYVIDTLNAYSALQNASFINPKRIGLWGHSMAGNVVMRSFAAKPDIPAVVIWAGAGYTYTDLSRFGIQDNSYRPQPTGSFQQNRRAQIRQKYGDPKDGNPFWKLVAVTDYLKDLKGAIQIHHAQDDQTVNIGYSLELIKLLDKTSVVHELEQYPTGGHNITGTSFNLAMQRTVEFFQKYLKSP